MANKCGKCKKILQEKHTLKCMKCKSFFHLDCTSASKRYWIMTAENKQNWKCQLCSTKPKISLKPTSKNTPKTTPISTPMSTPISTPISTPKTTPKISEKDCSPKTSSYKEPEQDYVTQRIKKHVINVSVENSFQSLSTSIGSDTKLDDTVENDDSVHDDDIFSSTPRPERRQKLNRSCPEIGSYCSLDIERMQKKISDLEERLLSTENELENTLSENYKLKGRIEKYELKMNQLMEITRSPVSKPTTLMKKKPISLRRDTLELNKVSKDLECDLKSPQATHSPKHNQRLQQPYSENSKQQLSDQYKKNVKKLCIISATPGNKVLNIAERNLSNTRVCHYCMPGGGIEQILNNIENKLQDYTYEDFCLLFIGEKDFEMSKNYAEIVKFIEDKLLLVQHTNVIICLPTYRNSQYANLFNYRVNTFNHLMYLNNVKNELAFILDCNKNLDYSTKMFNISNGKINNNAFSIIFKDALNLIDSIRDFYQKNNCYVHTYNNNMSNNILNKEDDFFRV